MILPAALLVIDQGTRELIEPLFAIRDQDRLLAIMNQNCRDWYDLKMSFAAGLVLSWFFSSVDYQEQLFAMAKKLQIRCQSVINFYMLLKEENQILPPYFNEMVESLKRECPFLVFDLSIYTKQIA